MYNLDFEGLCEKIKLQTDDFMFLDPPYNTKFSTYAKNEFNKHDQTRLANYLYKTETKFMLIIKNRNDKDVEHLIITNYEI